MARFWWTGGRASAALLCLWMWTGGLATAAGSTTVAEILEALRASGVEVLYSSDLVPPDLTVDIPLRSRDPLAQASEALRAHDLVLQSIGARRYLVTRFRSSSPSTSQAVTATVVEANSPTALEEISVYGSRYALEGWSRDQRETISAAEIEQVPGSQNDALRATRALPGLATNDSSRPYIRGSRLEDVLVQFDGVPLADPFHLKDFQSLISAFDSSAVDRIEVFSGGFPVQYGTRSGGVMEIAPRELNRGYEHAVGVSLLALDASSVGQSEHWPIEWLATIRHSVPDVVLKPVQGEIGEPQFSDTLGRVRWRPSGTSAWTLGWLALDDRIRLSTDPPDETAVARYRDEYVWLAHERTFSERLRSRTFIATTHAQRSRVGDLNIAGVAAGHVDEARSFDTIELQSEWTYEPSAPLTWTFGVEAGRTRAELKYARALLFSDLIAASFARPVDDSLSASVMPRASTYALFGSVRRRWSEFDAELGLRLDAQNNQGFEARQQWSPRMNVRYDLAPSWRLYGSWGRFTQAQRADEWRVEEGQSAPDAPDLSVHAILGLAYEESAATRLRLEVYRKRWTNVGPYFDNSLDSRSLLPDLEPDRVRLAPQDSESAGLELNARHALTPSLETWASYAWARVADEFTSGDVLRSWDQPHALTVGLAWSGLRTSMSTLVGWHRGWPRTPYANTPVSLTLGPRNSSRWGTYLVVDLRGTWTKPVRGGELFTWFELTNSTDRQNECCVHFAAADSVNGQLLTAPDSWLPRTLNLGISWRIRNYP